VGKHQRNPIRDNENLCFLATELDDEGEGEDGPLEEELIIHADEADIIEETPEDCCPDPCYRKFPFLAGDDDAPFWQGWANLRLKTFQLIENKYFETAVITMILLSSLALVNSVAIIF
jgi:voltage-gated sodium channel type II alpha